MGWTLSQWHALDEDEREQWLAWMLWSDAQLVDALDEMNDHKKLTPDGWLAMQLARIR